MDLSEMLQHQTLDGEQPAVRSAIQAVPQTHELAGQLGGEIAAPLSAALARIDAVLATGKLDRAGLNALRADVEQARRTAIVGQQIHRFAAAKARPSHEQIELGQLLREALLQRAAETEAHGLEVRQVIKPAQVVVDAPMLFSLLQAVLDWSIENARSTIEFRLEVKTWPVNALLSCRFGHQPADQVEDDGSPVGGRYVASRLDTMAWRLVQQAAQSLGLVLSRQDTPATTLLTLEFPRTVNQLMLATAANENDTIELRPAGEPAAQVNHVLVLASRREVRNQVREAIRHMNLMADYAHDIEAAREFIADATPQAVVYEAAMGTESFEALRRDLLARAPRTSFIQISEEGRALEISMHDGRQLTRIGRDAVVESLPSALNFELARAA